MSETNADQNKSTNRKKRVFKYFNGKEEVYADPFEVQWQLQEAMKMIPNIDVYDQRLDLPRDANGEWSDSVDDSQKKLYFDALHFYIPIITKAFDLNTFDKKTGEGLMGDEIIDVYSKYIEFTTEVKKNIE